MEQHGRRLRRRRDRQQLQSVGARYYQISIGQNSGYYLSPNAAYDKIVGIQPSKCSRRDLIADLSAALHKRGIRLMVYLPSGRARRGQSRGRCAGWQNGPHPNKEFQRKWEQVIREWSLRWGKGGRLVVRRLLLSQRHVPFAGAAQLRQLRRRGPSRKSGRRPWLLIPAWSTAFFR